MEIELYGSRLGLKLDKAYLSTATTEQLGG